MNTFLKSLALEMSRLRIRGAKRPEHERPLPDAG